MNTDTLFSLEPSILYNRWAQRKLPPFIGNMLTDWAKAFDKLGNFDHPLVKAEWQLALKRKQEWNMASELRPDLVNQGLDALDQFLWEYKACKMEQDDHTRYTECATLATELIMYLSKILQGYQLERADSGQFIYPSEVSLLLRIGMTLGFCHSGDLDTLLAHIGDSRRKVKPLAEVVDLAEARKQLQGRESN